MMEEEQTITASGTTGTTGTEKELLNEAEEAKEDPHLLVAGEEEEDEEKIRKKKRKKKKKKTKSPLKKRKTKASEEDLMIGTRQTRRQRCDETSDYFLELPLQRKKAIHASSPVKERINYSESYVSLFTRELSIEECNRMEASQQLLPKATGLAIPHWTVPQTIFSHNSVYATSNTNPIPSWWSHELQQSKLETPKWKPLRYHSFYHNQDYYKQLVNTSLPKQNSNPTQENKTQQQDETNQSSPLICQYLNYESAIQQKDTKKKDQADSTIVELQSNPNDNCTHSKDTIDHNKKQDPPDEIPQTSNTTCSFYYQLKSDITEPVSRACTVLAQSKQFPNIFALGDTAGYITIYSNLTLTSIARLETDASRRNSRVSFSSELKSKDIPQQQQEEEEPPASPFFKSSLVTYTKEMKKESVAANSLYSIEALCFVSSKEQEMIAYATQNVVEVLCPNNGQSLWKMDFYSPRSVLRLEACPTGSRLCIGFQEYVHGSPLALVQLDNPNNSVKASTTPIVPTETNGQTLVLGPRAVALWSIRRPNHLLCVVLTKRGENDEAILQQELLDVHVQTCSSENKPTFLVQHNAVLPLLKTASRVVANNETISLSQDGKFVVVAASGGGIRLFLEDNLELIGVYGEGIKMHSQTVVWQRVLLTYDDVGSIKGTDVTSSTRHVYLLAISHPYREPKDLRDTVHVWDITNHLPSSPNINDNYDRASVRTQTLPDTPRVNMTLPTFTIPSPNISALANSTVASTATTQGIQSLLFLPPLCSATGARLLITTLVSGECFVLSRTLRGSWPGCMYDPEYLVISNNIDYVEDEDELDYNVDAYREILLKEKQKEELAALNPPVHLDDESEKEDEQQDWEDEEIDVVCGNENTLNNNWPWICSPELFLQSKLFSDATGHPSEQSSSDTFTNAAIKTSPMDAVFSLLPPVVKESKKRFGIIRFDSSVSSQASVMGAAGRRRTGRSIDSLIVSSINENLQNEMTRRETEMVSDGLLTTKDYRETTVCLACHGRLVPHACGRRLIPEDTDALQRQEEERIQKIKEEEKQKRLEKKKAADLKRREMIRQQKEEKERKDKEKLEVIRNDELEQGLIELNETDEKDSTEREFNKEDKEAADLFVFLKSGRDLQHFKSEEVERPQGFTGNDLQISAPSDKITSNQVNSTFQPVNNQLPGYNGVDHSVDFRQFQHHQIPPLATSLYFPPPQQPQYYPMHGNGMQIRPSTSAEALHYNNSEQLRRQQQTYGGHYVHQTELNLGGQQQQHNLQNNHTSMNPPSYTEQSIRPNLWNNTPNSIQSLTTFSVHSGLTVPLTGLNGNPKPNSFVNSQTPAMPPNTPHVRDV